MPNLVALPRLLLAVWLTPLALPAETQVPANLRGHTVTLTRLEPNNAKNMAVVFLTGDGGWRGAAIAMSRAIAGWGYEVYGFDTKSYLETFSERGRAGLTTEQLGVDLRQLAFQIAGKDAARRVVFVGWSQGAAMSIAAVAGVRQAAPIGGVVTLGLPESGVLGWDWKATLASVARREPDQPKFAVRPLLSRAAPVPVWMIHGTVDEYTAPEIARQMFQFASEPKRLEEIGGANHRFDGHQDELYRSLRRGIEWVSAQ